MYCYVVPGRLYMDTTSVDMFITKLTEATGINDTVIKVPVSLVLYSFWNTTSVIFKHSFKQS